MTVGLRAVQQHAARPLLSGANPECRGEGGVDVGWGLLWSPAVTVIQLQNERCCMRDILPDVEKWRERGERVAVATVVTMYGSAPRRPGAKLAVSESGELAGCVSGGCVERAVWGGAVG